MKQVSVCLWCAGKTASVESFIPAGSSRFPLYTYSSSAHLFLVQTSLLPFKSLFGGKNIQQSNMFMKNPHFYQLRHHSYTSVWHETAMRKRCESGFDEEGHKRMIMLLCNSSMTLRSLRLWVTIDVLEKHLYIHDDQWYRNYNQTAWTRRCSEKIT